MCEEVFEMICAMDRRKVELQIVLQCAPTIAGLKTSNLLIVPKEQEDKIRFVLRHSGLLGYRLVYDKKRVIFLVFNKEMLMSYLSKEDVKEFLSQFGYRTDAFGYSLRNFQERYDSFVHDRKEFPHEIGLFLGYPPVDVECFIKNPCDGVKCVGCFKAYSNPEKAKRLFKRYDDCTKAYCELNKKGKTLEELAVLTG